MVEPDGNPKELVQLYHKIILYHMLFRLYTVKIMGLDLFKELQYSL